MNDEYEKELATLGEDRTVILDVGGAIREILSCEYHVNIAFCGALRERIEFDVPSLIAELVSCVECKNDSAEALGEVVMRVCQDFQEAATGKISDHLRDNIEPCMFEGILRAGGELIYLYEIYGLYDEEGCSHLRFQDIRHVRGLILEKYLDVGAGLGDRSHLFDLVPDDYDTRYKRWSSLYA